MDYSSYCAKGTTIRTSYVSVANEVQLFSIHFKPSHKSNYLPLIFFPGWGSLIDGWQIVLQKMTENFEIYYVESREKGSAHHPKEEVLTIDSLGNDLPYIINNFNLANQEYILFGSSLGATVILDAISNNKVDPFAAILIGPNAEFNAPRYWVWLTWLMPPMFFYFIKPIIKWYMKKKYLDMDTDPAQYTKYARALDAANPARLRRSALNFSKYKIWERLNNFHHKILIFSGSKDIMHKYDQTVKLSKLIQNCELIDMQTNNQTHSIEMVNKLTQYLNKELSGNVQYSNSH